MARYTRYTRAWLDQRYSQRLDDGVYYAHEPIYGKGRDGYSEPGRLWRLARHYQILRALRDLEIRSLLDVGSGEGFVGHLASQAFGLEAMSADLSSEACKRSYDLFAIPGVACDSSRLPFADASFDAVLCTEVLEHVEYPVETLLELSRVARCAVILTTEELSSDRAEVEAHRPDSMPHAERNLFHPDDFHLVFGPEVTMTPQFSNPPAEDVDDAEAARWIQSSAGGSALGEAVGVCAVLIKGGAPRNPAPLDDDRLVRTVLDTRLPVAPLVRRETPLESWIQRVVCPRCRQRLAPSADGVACTACSTPFPVDEGVACLHVHPDHDPVPFRETLEALWPGEAQRIEATVAFRERLLAEEPAERMAWDFGDAEHRGDWTLNDQLEALDEGSRGFALRASGNDPWLVSLPTTYPETGVAAIEIELACQTDDGATEAEGQIYWLGPGQDGFSDDRSVRFAITADGEAHSYRIGVFAPHPGPPGRETFVLLRLDPLDRPGRVELIAFRVVPAE